jgi:hypothetical protein
MATEGHERGRREGRKKKCNPEMDLELNEIRERMEQLALRMQQEAKVHWRYECPLNRKEKWHVQKLLARKKQQELRRWLRELENLSDTEEELIHICEPEIGRHLSDEEEVRSDEDLINCQVGRNGLSSCQVGNRKRSVEGLIYCQRSSVESSNFQVGNEMGSVDLIDCQVGRREVPNFQVGRGKEMRLSESLRSSEVSSGQQGVLIGEDSCGFADHVNEDDEKLNTFTIKEEDQRSILIIGGIKTFLPNNQVEASAHDESVQQKKKDNQQKTIKEEEMEQTLMSTPTEGEEHSKNCSKFSARKLNRR